MRDANFKLEAIDSFVQEGLVDEPADNEMVKLVTERSTEGLQTPAHSCVGLLFLDQNFQKVNKATLCEFCLSKFVSPCP